jgi:hypothetical protein
MSSSHINYYQLFRENNRVLDEILLSLEVLLDRKRTDFPRFYFLSNDELLHALSKGSRDPLAI